jgi:hypothetical protein
VRRILHPTLAGAEAPPAVNEVLRSPGQPLDAGARELMEPRFGEDFSRVRVHSDARASRSAEAVNARAYTVGTDLVFGRGEYAPGTARGRSLIAHELAHVVQQRSATTMKLTEIGWHYKDAGGHLQSHDAMMHDEPDLNSGDNFTKASDVMKKQWSQSFETSAVAIDGNQKGTFYGSVEWGWQRGDADNRTSLYTLKTKSKDVPSPALLEAARLWNISLTTEKKPTIDLPVNVHVHYDGAGLWDKPEGKVIATLTKDAPLARTAKVDPKGRIWWGSVVVTGGSNIGKRGWIREMDLAK